MIDMVHFTIYFILLGITKQELTISLKLNYKYKPNKSGKKRLISIMKPAVKLNHNVNKTGAVDKYF